MKKKILIGSILAVALMILISITNVVGYNTIKTFQEELIESKYSFDECKNYLFETLVEILENPDIKDIINSNYKPQRTILPFRRNNMDLKVEHLELLYNLGLKIMDILGEERVEELMENIKIPEYLDEIDTIVMGNQDLRERIYTLNEMNVESEEIDWRFPIICGILGILCVITGIIFCIASLPVLIILKFSEILPFQILYTIFVLLAAPAVYLFGSVLGIFELICFGPAPFIN